jgi:hypothetical protein
MKKYTIENNWIYYGTEKVYAPSKHQNADNIRECAENVHRFLLDNADISMLGGSSIFDWLVLSCAPEDFHYVMDAFNELNHDLLEDPDEEPYFVIDDDVNPAEFFGNVLIKWDMRSHSYKCYDMGIMDLQTLHDMLVFG